MACEHFLMVPRHVQICHAHTDVVEYLMFMDYRKYNYFLFLFFFLPGGWIRVQHKTWIPVGPAPYFIISGARALLSTVVHELVAILAW